MSGAATTGARPRPSAARAAGVGYAVLAVTDAALAGRSTARAHRLRTVTKPLLMPVLATAFASSTKDRRAGWEPLRRGTLCAQALSGLGDVALLAPGRTAFLTGLTSFLGAHVAYTVSFATAGTGADTGVGTGVGTGIDRAATKVRGSRALRDRVGVAAAVTGFACLGPVMSRRAGRRDPILRVPVLVYTAAITGMFAAATRLPRTVPARARRRVVAGSALFVVSDTVLATRQLVLDEPPPSTGPVVMATYCLGQGMIAAGAAEALRV